MDKVNHSGFSLEQNRERATLSRRQALKLLGLGAVTTAILAACGDTTTPTAPAANATTAPVTTTAATTAATTTMAAGTTVATTTTGATGTTTAAATGGATTTTAAAAATGSAYPTLSGSSIDQVVLAQGVDPTTLDPNDHNETPAGDILNNIYETLLTFTPDVKMAPRLAESWKQIDDNTWQFNLRKGVKWQDGSDFTADDVAYTVGRYLDANRKPRPIQRRANLLAVSEVKVVDPNTVQIITKNPYPALLNQLTTEPIVSKKYCSGTQGDLILAEHPMGTGPFKFVQWVKNDHIDLAINPDFWGPKQVVQKVRFRTVPDAQTRLSALQSGEVDLITDVAPELVDQLNKSGKVGVSTVPSDRVIFIILNSLDQNSPLKDAKVRQALNMGIDRDGIIKAILNGNGVKIDQPLTNQYFGYNPKVQQYTYDVDKAKQLLKDAGYANGFDITFNYPNGRYLKDKEIGDAIASQWNDLGIKVTTSSPVWTEYVGLINSRKQAQAFLLGWGNATWDPDNTLYTLLNTPKADLKTANGSVFSYWNNQQAQSDIVNAKSTVDNGKRQAMYQEAEQIIHDEAPWIFLHQQVSIYGVNKSKIKWQGRSDEFLNVFEMSSAT